MPGRVVNFDTPRPFGAPRSSGDSRGGLFASTRTPRRGFPLRCPVKRLGQLLAFRLLPAFAIPFGSGPEAGGELVGPLGDAKLEAMIHLRIGYACDNDASLGASHATAAAALLAGRADGDDLAACALLMSAEQRLMAGHAYDVSDVAAGRAILAQPASPVVHGSNA